MATQLGADGPAWARPYRSARPWAVATTIAFSLTIAYGVLLILVVAGYFAFLGDLGLADAVSAALTILGVVLGIGDAVTFLFWFAGTYRNLPALGAQDLDWSPRSAVLWWFAPFLAWVVPLLITTEIWKGSDSSISPNTRSSRKAARFPALLIPWWIAWLGDVFTGGVRRYATDPGIVTLLVLLPIAAAALGIGVVWRIQQLQDRRAGHE